MLLGIIKKDSGEITWRGKEVDRKNVNFGYLPEERGVYPKTKIFDQLMYFARLKGMTAGERAKLLISLAAPQFREELTFEAKKMNLMV